MNGGNMKKFKQLKPWKRWAIIFGGIYVALTISFLTFLYILGAQGEAWWVFSVFLFPSIFIGFLLPDFGSRINLLIFVLSMLLNTAFYAVIGGLAGAVIGRRV